MQSKGSSLFKKEKVIAEFLHKKKTFHITLSVKVYNNVSAVTLVSELVSIEAFNHILCVYFFSPNCLYVYFILDFIILMLFDKGCRFFRKLG